jgi:hypothetical protein
MGSRSVGKSSSGRLRPLLWLFIVSTALMAAPLYAQTSPLNDTGQTQCFEGGVLAECTAAATGDGASHPRQDGRFGRDAQDGAGALTKMGSGEAGFDFSKICNSGEAAGSGACPADPALGTGTNDWACTRDNVTGLIWEVKTPANATATFTFADASAVHAAAVNTAQLCGSADWRVPARRELLSMVQHGRSGPAIDTTFFPNVRSSFYWSSDIFALNTDFAWSVSFNVGDTNASNQAVDNHVRLVSGTIPPEPDPRFEDNLNGTVTDPATGLIWDQCSWGQTWNSDTNACTGSASTNNWQAALRTAVTANDDNHRNYNDWRLPNRTELESLVDITTSDPAIDTNAFPNTPSGFFWSSTVFTPNPAGAWYVSFNNGGTNALNQTFDDHVRLVRSGQSLDALAITVNTLDGGNDGVCGSNGQDVIQDCSLLEAIALANSDPTPAVIRFSVDGVIPISTSVVITTPVTIDGTTAPGGAHAVRIDATAAGNAIEISGADASGSEVRGLVIGQSPAAGLVISSGAANVRILGNYIGTNADGDNLGNGSQGVAMFEEATNNTIGGAAPGEGNTIGFNDLGGVLLTGGVSDNRVLGNFIGTDAAGNARANGLGGVRITGSAMNNTIGGAAPGGSNTIGFNDEEGVRLSDGASDNRVLGNFIGTNAAGDAMGNGFDGVAISEGATGNAIGGTASGEGNTIGCNGSNGVVIADAVTTDNRVLGNFIGTNAAGNELANRLSGVRINSGAANNTIGGAAPGEGNTIGFNGVAGVSLFSSDTTGNVIVGNFIGTNAAGDDLGNESRGVDIGGASTGNTIGGAAQGEGNTIGFNGSEGVLLTGGASGNSVLGNTIGSNGGAGVFLSSSKTTGNVVVGNFIGTNAAGDDLGNAVEGVVITGASTGNSIGGAAQGESNTIGFNDAEGVKLTGGASGNRVIGNFIGTNATDDELGNGSDGIGISGEATNNTIGGAEPGEGNTIGFNGDNGVLIAGTTTTGNAVLGNAIFDNATLGIDLSVEAAIGDGVTANDGCGDPDQGPNGLQNFPALLVAQTGGGITTVDFDLDTAAGDYRVEFFAVLAADPSGHGEGRTFLGAEQVSVSATCEESFQVELPLAVPEGALVTATATPVDGAQPSGLGGTSEFSAAVSTTAAPTQIAINAGDGQTGLVGQALAVAPSVIVRDANDNPVAGVEVTFAVATGGGTVDPTTPVITDASGVAATTSWTLGPSSGINTLTAAANGLAGSPLTFTATGMQMAPPIAVPTLGTWALFSLILLMLVVAMPVLGPRFQA